MATVTVSTEIICPDCGKRMAKKNCKDHARHKHTMTDRGRESGGVYTPPINENFEIFGYEK
jgi:hypothetical protein